MEPGPVTTKNTEAAYCDGVLKPEREVGLRERQRVRLTVETLDDIASDRAAALARLRAGIARPTANCRGRSSAFIAASRKLQADGFAVTDA